MDWSKTKTIFILTFLILDLFLGYQFIEKHNKDQVDFITEASIEEQLAAENITYINLPKKLEKETYLNAKSKAFTKEDLAKFKNQDVELLGERVVKGTFTNPIPLPDSNISFRLNQFLKDYIFSGESYVLWNVDKELNSIFFYQRYDDKTIYDNQSGMLIVYLNEKNEMISYEQTLLEGIEKMDADQDVLPPIKALENLYNKNELKAESKITKIDLGYYTFDLPLSSSQVLAPTWHIVVDGKTHYFINAFEGQIMKKSIK